MMCYLKQKLPNSDQCIYSLVTGVKTFEWNGKRFWIWHKERGKWYLVDYDSGCTVVGASTRYRVKEMLIPFLWDKLRDVYKKDYYKREVEKLDEYRKTDAFNR